MYLITILIVTITVIYCCPPEESLYPCTCKINDSTLTGDVICIGLNNDQELQIAAAACKNRPKIRYFRIYDSVMNYIPHSTFEGTLFNGLDVKGSVMFSLSDTEVAFAGLEKTLKSIGIANSTFMGEWDWSIFKHLTKVSHLTVNHVGLQSIDKDIENVYFVELIDLSNNKISWIYEHAFEKFQKLNYLTLSKNRISEIKRQMFPSPASHLRYIHLGQNQIQTLPIDLFHNMPKLNTLLIGENDILTLDEKTFSPIWDHLRYLEVGGNDLRCDCRMTWVITKRLRGSILGYCAEPPELKGTNLTKLAEKDLWC